MRTDPGKVFGILVMFAAILLSMVGTLATTSPSILDTDAATYVIVVMLMLFPFLLFMLKEDLHLNKDMKVAGIGVIIFVVYVLLLSYFRVGLSYVFETFRVDALLIPLLILSFSIILFGTSAPKKFIPIMIYSFFASPLILIPILLQNSAFASLNAAFVYNVLKSFGAPVTLSGINITSASNNTISIATTCAPIGTFIALLMFLIPVAYLYKGELKRKALWLASGFILMFVFNFARMFVIAYSWIYYGISQALSIFHLFAGQLLFYLAVIVMLLVAGKYGMSLDKLKKGQLQYLRRDFATAHKNFGFLWIIPIALGAVACLLSVPYLNAIYTSPSFFYGNISTIGQNSIYQGIGDTLATYSQYTIRLDQKNYTYSFAIINGTSSVNATYVTTFATTRPISGFVVTGANKIFDERTYLLHNGIKLTSAEASSGNDTFYIDYFAAPFIASGEYVSVNYEFFSLVNQSGKTCSPPGFASLGAINYIQSGVYDILSGNIGSSSKVLCGAFFIANSIQ
ncbi:MAG TPA: archaeosortase/exosortase family protein [Candidatus Acidoferrum sp.]|nr:archaeosortase/exosortase family protein [Candidatus Acidoferrum sp.]